MKRTELKRKTPLKPKGEAAGQRRGLQNRASEGSIPSRPVSKRRPISPASKAQREKAKNEPCVVTSTTSEWNTVDPAHLWPRGRGGCDDPLCIVPLAREIHERFDNGEFDLLPYLVGKRVPELCHALEHANGSLTVLLHRLTGKRHTSS